MLNTCDYRYQLFVFALPDTILTHSVRQKRTALSIILFCYDSTSICRQSRIGLQRQSRSQHFFSRKLRPEEPKSQDRERGYRVLWRGQPVPAPSPPAVGSVERCKLPLLGPRQSRDRQTVFTRLSVQSGLSR